MLEYFYPLIIVAAAVGLIELICPDGNISRSVKLVCSLVITAVLLLPLIRSLGEMSFSLSLNGSDFEYETANGADAVIDAAEKELCLRLKRAVAERLETDEEAVKIDLQLDRTDKTNVKITGISVDCGERSKEAAEYIKELTGIDASISQGQG